MGRFGQLWWLFGELLDVLNSQEYALRPYGGFGRNACVDFPEIKTKVRSVKKGQTGLGQKRRYWQSGKKRLSQRLPVVFCCKVGDS
ncbi:hypothetical protein CDL15_Pgr027298 [Punica granatum]|uniref:Uncharacterized protein n=1 Tax=Punica granatum TaxID=22663 RepID=A0A218XRY1_PUNGR|nr:hypothetical protein CDL15_Pgr027298 [Punica granatum]